MRGGVRCTATRARWRAPPMAAAGALVEQRLGGAALAGAPVQHLVDLCGAGGGKAGERGCGGAGGRRIHARPHTKAAAPGGSLAQRHQARANETRPPCRLAAAAPLGPHALKPTCRVLDNHLLQALHHDAAAVLQQAQALLLVVCHLGGHGQGLGRVGAVWTGQRVDERQCICLRPGCRTAAPRALPAMRLPPFTRRRGSAPAGSAPLDCCALRPAPLT
jgi:hypothetical protein